MAEMNGELRFRKIRLRNWKNFRDVEIPLGNRVFLVGPNASGKSNFLDAFRFLRDLVSYGGGFQESIRRRGGVSALRCLAARRYPDVELHVEAQSAADEKCRQYTLAFSQDNQGRPLIKKEVVVCGDETILQRPNADDKEDTARLSQTYLEQVNVNRPFRELAALFEPVRYLHLVPQLVREPDRSVGRANDPFGGDFLEQMAKTPERTRNARLRRISEALRVAVPQLKTIQLERDNRGVPHLQGLYEHWRPGAGWQSEEQFSDGTLRLAGLLWVVLEKKGLLLLEEPELSLHPEIVRVLPQMFAKTQNRSGRQIFISTHSPELLRDEGIGTDEVALLYPGTGGTELVLANSKKAIRNLLEAGISLAEIIVPQTRPLHTDKLPLFGGN